MNLYEINSEYRAILDKCLEFAEQNSGEIPQEFSDKLDAIEMDRDKKIENCLLYYKNEKAMAEAIKREIDTLSARSLAHSHNADWIKGYLAHGVPAGQKMEFPGGKISWRKSTSVEIMFPEEIPEKFMSIIPERKEPDKIAIKAAITVGASVSGAQLVESNHIQLK